MSDKHPPDNIPDQDSSSGDPMHELRNLLFNQEQEELAKLREQLEYFQSHPHEITAEELSDALPEAVVLRSARDQNLANALAPTIEESIQTSVKKDPQPLVDAIFPVIGPAIRKAISSALSGTIASMNQTLEHSFSIQGLKWRIEAYRTGRSFGEVVLTHTLLYRVEQVFLIHEQTGLLLQQAVSGSAVVEDADMVSSMLTAIQDFVRDSFGGDDREQLDNFQVGEHTIWIERGPAALLAAVIRGAPHQDLRETLQHAIETIHLELGPAFRNFSGDTEPFAPAAPHLQACLESQLTEEQEKKRVISPAFAVVMSLILIGIGVWAFFVIRDRWRWADYLEALNAEPGIVVTDTGTKEGRFYVEGLRDPMAADPASLLPAAELTPDQVTGMWEPYQAFYPTFIAARAARLLELPPSAALRVEEDILYLSGAAPKAWLETAYRQIRFLPAITEMIEEEDFSTLEMQALLTQKELLETLLIDFPIGSTGFDADAQRQVETVSGTIIALLSSAAAADYTVHIEITGHTDPTGSEELNQAISRQRADEVLASLIRQGFNPALFTTRGVGAAEIIAEGESEEALALNRRVTFRVILTEIEEEDSR